MRTGNFALTGAEEDEPVGGVLAEVGGQAGGGQGLAHLAVHHLHRSLLPVEDCLDRAWGSKLGL